MCLVNTDSRFFGQEIFNSVTDMSKIHVDPTTGHFVDEAGRVRMFRGVNSVYKQFPWYHDIIRNNTMVKRLADIGMNIVRLGNMWDGWQPHSPHHINTTYANILQVSTGNICNYFADTIYVSPNLHTLYCRSQTYSLLFCNVKT